MATKKTKSTSTRSRKKVATKSSKVLGSGKGSFFSRRRFLLIPLLVLFVVGGFGVWATTSSRGDTTALSELSCYLRVRNYSATYKKCYASCLPGAGSFTTRSGVQYGWCSSAVSTGIAYTKCKEGLGRKWVTDTGCARRWVQTSSTSVRQCITTSSTIKYFVSSPYDYCKSASSSTSSGDGIAATDSWGWPLSTNSGVGGYVSGHYARDFRGNNGYNVEAVASGKVVWSGRISSGCGDGLILRVQLTSGTYLYPTYEHLKNYKSAGTYVSKGQVIGEIGAPPAGSNDCWSGYHLHLGVQKQGSYVESHRSDPTAHPDPCKWISGC